MVVLKKITVKGFIVLLRQARMTLNFIYVFRTQDLVFETTLKEQFGIDCETDVEAIFKGIIVTFMEG